MVRTSIHSEQRDATDDGGPETRGKREERGKRRGRRCQTESARLKKRGEKERERERQKLIDEKSERGRVASASEAERRSGGRREGGLASGSLTITKAPETRENH